MLNCGDGKVTTPYSSLESGASLENWDAPRFALPPSEQLPSQPRINPNIQQLEFKPKPILEHERGAGASCLKCKDACPGLDLHFWRRICKSCKCRPEDHDVHDVGPDPGRIRIGRLFDIKAQHVHASTNSDLYNVLPSAKTTEHNAALGKRTMMSRDAVTSLADRKALLEQQIAESCPQKYEWIPINSNAKLVDKFMRSLPENARPIHGTEGATRRKQALEYQFPLYDCDPEACNSLSEEERVKATQYVNSIKDNAVGLGMIAECGDKMKENYDKDGNVLRHSLCVECNKVIHPGDVYVYTDHTGADSRWHPGCFSCSCCKELLVDLLYFFKAGKFFCGRHYGDSLFPRCKACDELIFASEYTRAEDESWHLNHFCCWHCDRELGGHRYMVKQNNPHCMDCYLQLFARTCYRCNEKIAADVKRISHKDLHWHATQHCFHCDQCRESLVERKFIIKGCLVFCSSKCKDALFSTMSRSSNNAPIVTDL